MKGNSNCVWCRSEHFGNLRVFETTLL
ncbi:MAG: hypothetical protein DMG96_38095 [Acidobacteria bacterium]|nr:MAG: hypothetical protein DMG98_28595 [Acidobacteriota bacterium]PYV67854.1 MAG: hypothetical protein DMG96_38095 [Acidobacteriota bacterium]